MAADDVVSMTVGFDDGSIGTVHYFANGAAAIAKERFEAFGQERAAVLEDYRALELATGGKKKSRSSATQQKGFAEEAAAFLAACRRSPPA